MKTIACICVGCIAVLLLTACVARGTGRSGDVAAGVAAPDRGPLIVVRNRALNPFTGEVVRKYDVANPYLTAMPVPGRPGWYEIPGGPADPDKWECAAYRINPSQSAFERVPFPAGRVQWDEGDRTLVSYNGDGTERWRYGEPGQVLEMGIRGTITRNYAIWASAVRGRMQYLGYAPAVVALDMDTGKEVWRIPQGCDEMLEGDEFLLAVFHEPGEEKVHLEVRALAYDTGDTIFRVPLGEYRWPLARLFRSGACYGVDMQPTWGMDKRNNLFANPEGTKLFYPDGRIALSTTESLHKIVWVGDDRLVTSGSRTVSSWKVGGELVWEVDVREKDEDGNFEVDNSFQRELLVLPNGDVIACRYPPIACDDVVVTCYASADGKPRWTATCESEPVGHSKYSHEVYAELIDNKLVVVSQQSYCVFVEVLEPKTGKQLHRWVLTEALRGDD